MWFSIPLADHIANEWMNKLNESPNTSHNFYKGRKTYTLFLNFGNCVFNLVFILYLSIYLHVYVLCIYVQHISFISRNVSFSYQPKIWWLKTNYHLSQFCGLSGFNLEVLLLVLSLTGGCNKMGLELYEGRWDARMTGPLSLSTGPQDLFLCAVSCYVCSSGITRFCDLGAQSLWDTCVPGGRNLRLPVPWKPRFRNCSSSLP